jgi:agmatinase
MPEPFAPRTLVPGKPCLLGIPFDENSSFLRGAAKAPAVIRWALYSDSSNLWAENGTDLGRLGTLGDAGDLEFSGRADEFDRIEESVATLLGQGCKPLCLGGDHSIVFPVVKAFRRKYAHLHILQFDAHPDLYEEFQGNRFSHACPFARILEANLAERLMQVGIRTMNAAQREQATRFGVEVVEMKDWHAGLRLAFDVPLYISVDLDVLDPAYAPGVSHHEPGGFTTRELLAMIQSIQAEIVGADIVELNPDRDPQGVTAMAAAKILKELAARMQ